MFMRERSIIMNCGKPGHLQMISIDDGKLISNVRHEKRKRKRKRRKRFFFSMISVGYCWRKLHISIGNHIGMFLQ